jgi:hypothetical protein
MERINKLYIIIGLAIAFGLFFEIAAHADELDEATTVTFNAPVQIPGQVLPAGTYLFKLVDTETSEDIVQIFNPRGDVLYATVMTIPTERQQPTGDTVITFAEQSQAPEALLKWFYPGNLTGNQFVYSNQEQNNLAHDVQQTVAVNSHVTNSEAQTAD